MDPTNQQTPGIYSVAQQGPSMQAGTPTPQQIAQAYNQAAIMKAQGLSTEPIHSWTQGVNQMLKALVGNYKGNQADALQRAAADATARAGNPANAWATNPGAAPYMPPVTNAPASTWSGTVPFMNAPFSAGGGQ